MKAINAQHGPHSVAICCGTCAFQNSAGPGAAIGFANGTGTRNIHTSVTRDQPAKVYTTMRMGQRGGGLHGFSGADACIFIGNNPPVSRYPPGWSAALQPVARPCTALRGPARPCQG